MKHACKLSIKLPLLIFKLISCACQSYLFKVFDWQISVLLFLYKYLYTLLLFVHRGN
eukprot:c42311_g1_i1 orf=25-195(+)